MVLTVYFAYDESAAVKQETLSRILKTFGGNTGDCGVCLAGPYAGRRDVECEIPDDRQRACAAELRKAGFEVEESEAI